MEICVGRAPFGRWTNTAVLALAVLPSALVAQDRLKTMPGYEQYSRVAPQIAGSVKLGSVQPFWSDSGAAFEYQRATSGVSSM